MWIAVDGGHMNRESWRLVGLAAFGGSTMPPRPLGKAVWFSPGGEPLTNYVERRYKTEMKNWFAGPGETRADLVQVGEFRERHGNNHGAPNGPETPRAQHR